ncbi:MAG: DUF4249 domain-containing protein [Tunicatimonas sp.]
MKDFRKFIRTLVIGLVLLTNACVEPIAFDTDPVGGQLIVTGRITNAPGGYEITLKRTDQSEAFPVPVNGAQVTLRDDQGQQETFQGQGAGVYRTAGQIQGQPGETYEIEITLFDGTVYRSRPETMSTAIGKDSVYYEVAKEELVSESGVLFEDRVVRAYVDTQLPANAPLLYLKWDVETVYSVTTINRSPLGTQITYCYFYNYPDAQEILLFNRRELPEGNTLKRQLVAAREIDFSFLERHYFNVIQSSLTPGAYDYWNQVGQLSNRTGSVFDTPPGLVSGNIYNVEDAEEPVLGYFETSLVDTARFFLNRQDIPFIIGSTCQCTACSDLPGVRFDRPSYF